jgi:hypothetical protein
LLLLLLLLLLLFASLLLSLWFHFLSVTILAQSSQTTISRSHRRSLGVFTMSATSPSRDTCIQISIVSGGMHRIVTAMKVNTSDTIGDVLAKVELATKVPRENQCIIFAGIDCWGDGKPPDQCTTQARAWTQAKGWTWADTGQSSARGGGNIEGKGSYRGKGSGKSMSFGWDIGGKGSGKSMETDSGEVGGAIHVKGKKRNLSVAAGGGMQIMVSMGWSDDLCVVNVEKHDKVEVVKLKILRIMKLSSGTKISMMFDGKHLQDNLTLPDYNINNEAQIHIAIGG